MSKSDEFIVLGRVTSPYGIKGWVKVFSYTDPMDQILDYQNWFLKMNNQWVPVDVDRGRSHGKGMIAHIVGCDDRDDALGYGNADIAVKRDQLPDLEEGDFYWYELEGLRVITLEGVQLGSVKHLMSAGSANDVLVVKGDSQSIDSQERLIPYLPENTVKEVNLETGTIKVDWDPDF